MGGFLAQKLAAESEKEFAPFDPLAYLQKISKEEGDTPPLRTLLRDVDHATAQTCPALRYS